MRLASDELAILGLPRRLNPFRVIASRKWTCATNLLHLNELRNVSYGTCCLAVNYLLLFIYKSVSLSTCIFLASHFRTN